jgi:hypothetical protein
VHAEQPREEIVASGIDLIRSYLCFSHRGVFAHTVLAIVALSLTLIPPVSNAQTGVVGNALSQPVFVNLYWDVDWDAHNPSMTKQQLDGFVIALLNSSYFGRLSEYGVGSPTFAGGFLPAPLCPQRPGPGQAPSSVGSVGFYDPINVSIIGFLNCELQHGGIPQGSQVIYNIILPSGSVESDLFGSDKFCVNGPAVAWHFHQTPYSPGAAIAIGLGLLGAATGGVPGALEAFLGALAALQGGPLYTISSADSRCGSFTHNLLHEMVEAASDPFPPPSVIINGGTGEIVDICDAKGVQASRPFVPNVQPLSNTSFPVSSGFTNPGTIEVPQYWSNSAQTCVTGYTNTVMPNLQNNKITITGNGAAASFVLTGSGFGTLPPPLTVPTSSALPYIAIQDTTQGWQVGNSLNTDEVPLNIAAWSDSSITINGFSFSSGNLVMKAGDNLAFWVCNAASGNCTATNHPLSESGSPQLKVSVFNSNNVALSYNVYVDGKEVEETGPVGGSTGWLPLSSGTHTVSEKATSSGFTTARYADACSANGQVVLNIGDNTICSIINVVAPNCPGGQHCCSGATTSSGCIAGCVPDSTQCLPLCAPGFHCCGGALPNGRCDDACIKPPHECP